MEIFLGLLPSLLMIVAPLLITAAGGMICERSGIVNIALEGLMAIGAFSAAASHVLMEPALGGFSVWIALFFGAVCGLLFSIIHAVASISFKADQTVSGTGLNLLSTGVTVFVSQILFSADRTKEYKMGIPTMKFFFGAYPTIFIALFVIVCSWILLYKLPFGLRLRACGEHPQAAASVGIEVKNMRYFGVLSSGFLAGLAGGCLVLTYTTQYTPTLINGTGFIALAAISFGRWSPRGITLSTLLFGSAVAFSIYVVNIPTLRTLFPSEFFSLLPYLLTLCALIVFSGKNYAPHAAGKPYEKDLSSE
ncbi:MAG: ABC transporter permease [Treponemataceae bacterium]